MADLVPRGAQAIQTAIALGQEGEDRARHGHARRPVVSGLDPRPAVGAQLLGLDITERLVPVLEDQGRAHEVDAVAGRLDRRGVGSRAVPDPGSQAGRVRQDRQGRARVQLRRILLVQGRGLRHGAAVDGLEEALVVGAGEVGAVPLFRAVTEGFPPLVGDLGGAARDAEGGATVRDQVQGGGLFGEVQGVLVAHVDDSGADLDGLRARGNGGE